MRYNSLLLFILLFVSRVDAQEPPFVWVNQLSGPHMNTNNDIEVDINGNVYVFGEFFDSMVVGSQSTSVNLTPVAIYDMHLIKYNSSGEILWARRWGNAAYEHGMSMEVDPNGNIYVTGDSGPEIMVIKFNTHGNELWRKSFVGSTGASGLGHSIALDDIGNVYSTGVFWGTVDFDPGNGTYNLTSSVGHTCYLSKLDTNGNFVWAHSLGGGGWLYPNSITVDQVGDILLTGYYENTVDFDPGTGSYDLSSNGYQDFFVAKYDVQAQLIWAKGIGGIDPDQSNIVRTDLENDIYVGGRFLDTVDFDPGTPTFKLYSRSSPNAFLLKLDENGAFKWVKRFEGSNWSTIFALAFNSKEDIYVIGSFISTTNFDPGFTDFSMTSKGNNDVFIVKFDSLGTFINARSFGGSNFDIARDAIFDASDNLYIVGSFAGSSDYDPSADSTILTSTGLEDGFILKLGKNDTIVPTGVHSEHELANSRVYPNPTRNQLIVEMDNLSQGVEIMLLDITGNVLSKVRYENQNKIEIQINGKPGVYFVQLITDSGESATYRVIKT